MKYFLTAIILSSSLLFSIHSHGQGRQVSSDQLNKISKEYARKTISKELVDFLRIPNNAANKEDISKNLEWLKQAFEQRSFSTRTLPTPSNDVFFAERLVKKAKFTVLFYMHFDGQPVDSSKWMQESPYIPVLKKKGDEGEWTTIDWKSLDDGMDPDWRVFARSSSDDKGPIIMLLAALDAMESLKKKTAYNIKVILDSEEEMGSPNLQGVVEKYGEVLSADRMVIFDGPMHDSGLPTLIFGGRGIATLTLKSYGPRAAQHSGHFGNYAPNPALELSRLLASMKDAGGRVIIPGFYDGINLTPEIQAILKSVPDDIEKIKGRAGFATADKVGSNYQEAMQYPSLNIRGLSSGWVGDQARTIVPATATAEIDIRLVPESDGDRLLSLVKSHIADQGYYVIENREPTEEERMTKSRIISFSGKNSWEAFSTPVDSETGNWLNEALVSAYGGQTVRIRLSGGSVPIAMFVKGLNVPAVLIPLVNPDNNQHSPNENLRVGNYIDGVKSILAVLLAK